MGGGGVEEGVMRVLLVDDSPVDRKVVQLVLGSNTFAGSFDVIGYDLLKAIKAMSPLKPIPVIVMSSENEPQRISRCLKAGAEDYIVKPLQTKDVPRLRNCSNSKPKDPSCNTVSKRMLPADHAVVVDGTSSPGRRAHLTEIATVLHSSSAGFSHYFPFLFKFILLVYAILCLGELLHRWSSGAFLSLW